MVTEFVSPAETEEELDRHTNQVVEFVRRLGHLFMDLSVRAWHHEGVLHVCHRVVHETTGTLPPAVE